jgi:hypothetical protein
MPHELNTALRKRGVIAPFPCLSASSATAPGIRRDTKFATSRAEPGQAPSRFQVVRSGTATSGESAAASSVFAREGRMLNLHQLVPAAPGETKNVQRGRKPPHAAAGRDAASAWKIAPCRSDFESL